MSDWSLRNQGRFMRSHLQSHYNYITAVYCTDPQPISNRYSSTRAGPQSLIALRYFPRVDLSPANNRGEKPCTLYWYSRGKLEVPRVKISDNEMKIQLMTLRPNWSKRYLEFVFKRTCCFWNFLSKKPK